MMAGMPEVLYIYTRSGAVAAASLISNQMIKMGSIMANVSLCAKNGCGKRVLARGLCSGHYQSWRKRAEASEVRVFARPGEPMKWLITHVSYDGDDCLTWPFSKYSTGYGSINLPNGGSTPASRHMCRKAHGNPDGEDMQAAHTCGNGHNGCVNPKHLYWATRSENEADKILHGTSNRGVGNGHAKITEHVVRFIRSSPLKPKPLAEMLGISFSTVYDIRARRSWAWLD